MPYFTLLCFLPPSLILPHPPLLSSILMLGLGGLTCLVIDGNVSGSHFPQQHPAAFHQAWCRGEPITWMLLTLCSLHPGLSDHLSPSILDSIPTTTPEPPTSAVIVEERRLLILRNNSNCFQINKIILPKIFYHTLK